MPDVLRPIFVIARREVRDWLRDWRIILPAFGLTIIFPFLMNFTASQAIGLTRQYGQDILGERFVPFLLMIVGFFPITTSQVMALESFVGEKERGSIEPLLNAPTTDWQLYLGKLAASVILPLITSLAAMAVYMGGLLTKGIPLPNGELMALILLLTIVQTILMVSGGVVVSSQATTVRAANMLSGFIIIPVSMLIIGEVMTMIWSNYSTLWWILAGLVILCGLLIRVGMAQFQRERLLGREIDVLNFRWMGRVFWNNFKGEARNLREWYLSLFKNTLPNMRLAVILVILLVIAGGAVGSLVASRYPLSFQSSQVDRLWEQMRTYGEVLPGMQTISPVFLFWQNLRVLIVSYILGSFSFGVLGVLPILATMGLTGALVSILSGSGLMPLGTVLLLLLPHGIFEIPAAVLACSAMLQSGALLAAPASGRTVGEISLIGLAEWCKVMVGMVVPLLIAAALIESMVTPRIVAMLLR